MILYPEIPATFRNIMPALGIATGIILIAFFVFSCNRDSENSGKASSNMARGEALVIQNRCFNCHRKNAPSTGPAYSQVKQKYSENDLNRLIESVSKGGAGTWGSVIMPPHPQLSISEIDTMVSWILAGDF